MKTIRIILAGIAVLPAVFSLWSFGIGLVNAINGALTYGTYRAVASLLLCALFSTIAFYLWPKTSNKNANLKDEFDALHDSQSRGDFIASIAASKLRVSREKFDLSLTNDLKYGPKEVMDLWDNLADEFGVSLSSDDFPHINSIEGLRTHLGNSDYQTEPIDGGNA